MTRLEPLLRFKVKVVERSGTSLRNMMPNTNPWAGANCSRTDCVTCTQDCESKPDCMKRNLVYEHICTLCNPDAKKSGELETINLEVPSVYVGETARSIYERAKEHCEAFRSRDQDSHILKHWTLHHGSEGHPEFTMKVVHHHRSALSRQVGEAIRIRKRGGVTLNSKSEYNRCKITRLSLEQAEEEKTEYSTYMSKNEEDISDDWSDHMLTRRDMVDKTDRLSLGKLEMTSVSKRKDDSECGEGKTIKRRRTLKYDRLGDDWGNAEDDSQTGFLYSGLEGVRRQVMSPMPVLGKSRVRKKCRALEVAAKDSQKITDWTGPGLRCARVDECPMPVVSALECDTNDAIECKLELQNAGVEGQDECENECEEGLQCNSRILSGSEKELSSDGPAGMPTATKGGKKVWTRLNNGLYGWRKRKVGLRRIERTLKGTDGELESSSENIENTQTKTLLPAGSSIKTGKVSVNMSRKHLILMGGQISQEGKVKVGIWKRTQTKLMTGLV